MRHFLIKSLLLLSLTVSTAFQAHAAPAARAAKVELPKADAIVDRARELLGIPYRWGGTSVHRGFDCSGLIVYLFGSEANIHLPRTTQQMLHSTKAPTVARSSLRAGDVVFFNHNGGGRVSHMGLYIGGGRFIHAPRTGKTIRISKLDSAYWSRHYIGAKRFLGGASAASRVASSKADRGNRDQPVLASRSRVSHRS